MTVKNIVFVDLALYCHQQVKILVFFFLLFMSSSKKFNNVYEKEIKKNFISAHNVTIMSRSFNSCFYMYQQVTSKTRAFYEAKLKKYRKDSKTNIKHIITVTRVYCNNKLIVNLTLLLKLKLIKRRGSTCGVSIG